MMMHTCMEMGDYMAPEVRAAGSRCMGLHVVQASRSISLYARLHGSLACTSEGSVATCTTCQCAAAGQWQVGEGRGGEGLEMTAGKSEARQVLVCLICCMS